MPFINAQSKPILSILENSDNVISFAVGGVIGKMRAASIFENHQISKASFDATEADGTFVAKIASCEPEPKAANRIGVQAFEAYLPNRCALFDHTVVSVVHGAQTVFSIGNGMKWFTNSAQAKKEKYRICRTLKRTDVGGQPFESMYLSWCLDRLSLLVKLCSDRHDVSTMLDAMAKSPNTLELKDKLSALPNVPLVVSQEAEQQLSADLDIAVFLDAHDGTLPLELRNHLNSVNELLGDIKYDISKSKNLIEIFQTIAKAIDVQPYGGFTVQDTAYATDEEALAQITSWMKTEGGVGILVEGFEGSIFTEPQIDRS